MITTGLGVAMSNIVIFGGAGFIGTRLAARLTAAGRSFYIADKNSSETYSDSSHLVDVRDLNGLRNVLKDRSVLINLAAEHRDDVRPKSLYDDVNVKGAENLCVVAREKNIQHIIFTSSVAVYGFAPANTGEDGEINYFNDYGRTKWEAEKIFRVWQQEDPETRTLVVVRPTVVFGEQNRGNVYNLLRQIASGKFLMIGKGTNKKSMAYVENVTAFLEHSLSFQPGIHTYNYIDKPDFNMTTLVGVVRKALGKSGGVAIRIPYSVGYLMGLCCDLVANITGKSLPVSSIRVKKFCATTQFNTAVSQTGFVPPVSLEEGLRRTVTHEFVEDNSQKPVFYTE